MQIKMDIAWRSGVNKNGFSISREQIIELLKSARPQITIVNKETYTDYHKTSKLSVDKIIGSLNPSYVDLLNHRCLVDIYDKYEELIKGYKNPVIVFNYYGVIDKAIDDSLIFDNGTIKCAGIIEKENSAYNNLY